MSQQIQYWYLKHITVDFYFLNYCSLFSEADAARTAGMATCILVRDGLIDENDTKDHPKVQNFNQITLSDVVVGGADSLAAKIPKLPDSVELNGASDDKAK